MRLVLHFACSLAVALSLRAAAPSPAEAVSRMRVPPGFSVTVAAAEPDIRQPLSVSFDSRGRMWVMQYLQYPNPAGLKPVSVDQYLRTKYDHVPEPPPRGPKGADRITICEDTDGDGRFDAFKDFVSGLNIASGMALGHGGVFIVQPPYLLFYADKNGDDITDGDPEVLLSGFGLEDSHAVANSLTWGPDGWLYGAQGSTVTAKIRGIEFQQGVWRYHPKTREFELFAEGGGNTWGLDFNEDGEVIVGTNFGEVIALHQVQGGYYIKGFAKHGPLHNPHTYGYLDHIPYTGWKGGRVITGGVLYHGGLFPAEFNGVYIGANLLRRSVDWHVFERAGSTFKGGYGGTFIVTEDETFRPIDCTVGPDGAVYVVDWCDQRASHVDPVDNWDKKTGRIYRITPTATPKPLRTQFNFARETPQALLSNLTHSNDWFRREARLQLASRTPAEAAPLLRANMQQSTNSLLALQSLWALHTVSGLSAADTTDALRHPDSRLRFWAIRLLGDTRALPAELTGAIAALARTETSANVRAQIASSAKRWPASVGMPIVRELLRHDADLKDTQIPLLLWWAVEDKAISHPPEVLALLSSAADWNMPFMRDYLLERIARRYASETNRQQRATCAWLLNTAPSKPHRSAILRGFDAAWQGEPVANAGDLAAAFAKSWSPNEILDIRLGIRLGVSEAEAAALQKLTNTATPTKDRIALAQVLGECSRAGAIPEISTLLNGNALLQTAAITALQSFSEDSIAAALIDAYPKLAAEARTRARSALTTRPAWARQAIAAVDADRLKAADFSNDQVQQMVRHADADLINSIEKRWGKVQERSSEEKLSTINTLKLVLNPSGTTHRFKGDSTKGKVLYTQLCGTCHRLFNEGNALGPELTGSDRKNTEWLLSQIVDPSAFIRPEYVNHNVETKDGRSLTGLVAEQSDNSVTIVDAQNQRTLINRSELQTIAPSSVSLMPEGLLEPLSPEQLRDLFSYLQLAAP